MAALLNTNPMPVLFVGHGSPMNAISENEFTDGWKDAVKKFPRPAAILCISAHWETSGTFVTAMENPKTIHDFYGFPKPLFDVSYPAPGSPELAKETKQKVTKVAVGLDYEWGLDHGCWSALKHMFPEADIPTIQLSLDSSKDPQWHNELAKELSSIREKGVLIIGSGNIVHNLGMMDWKSEEGFDWAIDANEQLKMLIVNEKNQQLIQYQSLGKEMKLAVPTPEHYLPLLYTLALKKEGENLSFFNDKVVFGSISMTSLKIGET